MIARCSSQRRGCGCEFTDAWRIRAASSSWQMRWLISSIFFRILSELAKAKRVPEFAMNLRKQVKQLPRTRIRRYTTSRSRTLNRDVCAFEPLLGGWILLQSSAFRNVRRSRGYLLFSCPRQPPYPSPHPHRHRRQHP